MNKKINPVIWFEIPVVGMERGKAFYEAVLDQKLTVVDMGSRQMAMFPMKMGIAAVNYLGNVLPASIMIILVVYCLRNIDLTTFPFGLAELLSVAIVIAAQVVKKNTFLSIFFGTACYMILIHTVFF